MYLLKPRSRQQPACRRLLSALVAAVLSIGAATVSLADDENSAEARIYKALGEKTKIDFREKPLQEIADYLSGLHKIKMQLDKLVLEDAGIGPDTLVTRNLQGISLRSALRLVLIDLELTYVVDDEVLLITTADEASTRLTTKFYPVADLVDTDPETPYSPDDADFDPLIALIRMILTPPGWDVDEDLGTVRGFAKSGALVANGTHDVHEQVGLLLATLRRLRAAATDTKAKNGRKEEHENEEIVRVYRVSNVKGLMPMMVTAAKDNTEVGKWSPPDYAVAKRSAKELADLIKKAVAPNSWGTKHGIRTIPGTLVIWQSRQVHREIRRLLKGMDLLDGATTLSPVTDAIPDRSGLPTTIHLRELTFVIRDEVLLITTPDEANLALVTQFYPAKDLVAIFGDTSILGEGSVNIDSTSLIEVIHSTVAPDSWDKFGGPGAIVYFEPSAALAVSQTEDVHWQIAHFLQKLRQMRDAQFRRDMVASQDDAGQKVLQAYRVAIEANSIPATDLSAEGMNAALTAPRGRVPRTVGADFICGTCLAAGYRGTDMTERQMALNNLAFLPNEDAADRAMQDLVSLIRGSIEPKSWSGDEDAAIYTIEGRLVVRHTVQVQRRIATLLSQTGLLLPPVRKPTGRGKGGGGDSGGGGGMGGGAFGGGMF